MTAPNLHGFMFMNSKKAGVSPELQIMMQQYCTLVLALIGPVRLQGFLFEVNTDLATGYRVGFKETDGPQPLTHEIIAKRSNKTSRPLFEMELNEWLCPVRHLVGYPYEKMGDLEFEGIRLVDQFTYEEFIAFCIWIESQKPGAGKDLYAGPLVGGAT
jgi:hypothetical protein